MLINCPECTREISDKANSCPNCGYVLPKVTERRIAPTEPLPKKQRQPLPNTPNKNSAAVAIFGLLGFVIIALLVWRGCGGAPESAADSADQCDAGWARVTAERFVEAKLKSPSTASFSWEPTIASKDKKRWTVDSYVDSQNGFGATLRTKFHAVVICKGDGNWTLESLTID